MGVFNFIETFFFISLGITLVLILLLVYHFKQRLTTLEQQGDTMFEIVNSLAKEMTQLKEITVLRHIHSPPFGANIPSFSGAPVGIMHNLSDGLHNSNTVYREFNTVQEDDDDDDEDEDDDDDEDEDDDDDEETVDEDEESIESVNLDVIENEKTNKIIVSDDEGESEPLDVNGNIDIVHIEITQEEDIAIETVDIMAVTRENINSEETTNPIEPSENTKNVAADTYNKMTTSELKALVTQKGLSTEPTKLKRAKLLNLLEASLE